MSDQLLEGLFVGRRPGEALDYAQHVLEIRAEGVAFTVEDLSADEARQLLAELREACAAVHVARERLCRELRPTGL